MKRRIVYLAKERARPDPGVVGVLTESLARAKRGELRSVVVCGELEAGATCTAFATGDGDLAHMVLAIETLKLRLLTEPW